MCGYWWLCRQHMDSMDRATPFPGSQWQFPRSHVFPTCSEHCWKYVLFLGNPLEISIHSVLMILQITLLRCTGSCRENHLGCIRERIPSGFGLEDNILLLYYKVIIFWNDLPFGSVIHFQYDKNRHCQAKNSWLMQQSCEKIISHLSQFIS